MSTNVLLFRKYPKLFEFIETNASEIGKLVLIHLIKLVKKIYVDKNTRGILWEILAMQKDNFILW